MLHFTSNFAWLPGAALWSRPSGKAGAAAQAAAARRGCTVTALDGSPAAVTHLAARARAEQLAVTVACADLRSHAPQGHFDAVAAIGRLMSFDCETAARTLAALQDRIRPGGVAAVNVLIEGTTCDAMFDPSGHCLFGADQLRARFAGWHIEQCAYHEFPAPGATIKRFCTVVARKIAP
jgi:tellurite methyltransferase